MSTTRRCWIFGRDSVSSVPDEEQWAVFCADGSSVKVRSKAEGEMRVIEYDRFCIPLHHPHVLCRRTITAWEAVDG